mmetsp:Transcript_35578/g.70857  ORF Transcript_35578/g.70857 Transcript_35578/m.70857 type:complete len:141 (-) Transcript_35578:448-870(-)
MRDHRVTLVRAERLSLKCRANQFTDSDGHSSQPLQAPHTPTPHQPMVLHTTMFGVWRPSKDHTAGATHTGRKQGSKHTHTHTDDDDGTARDARSNRTLEASKHALTALLKTPQDKMRSALVCAQGRRSPLPLTMRVRLRK